MSRKQREAERRKKQEKKVNSKQTKYHQMAKNKELGNIDKEKYREMYFELEETLRISIKSPSQNPNRDDYNNLRIKYYQFKNKQESQIKKDKPIENESSNLIDKLKDPDYFKRNYMGRDY